MAPTRQLDLGVKWLSIYRGSYVNRIGLYCRIWQGTGWGNTGNLVGPAGGSGGTYDRRDCLEHSQPVVAIHGRKGWYVHAIGITCDEVSATTASIQPPTDPYAR